MTVLYRGTNVDESFPRCFDRVVIKYLGVVDISSREPEGGSPVSDTHIQFFHQGKYTSPYLEVTFLCLYQWKADGLGECLVLIIFCEELRDVVHIERAVGVDCPLDGFQLGSARIEVDHSECVGFILVGWWRA